MTNHVHLVATPTRPESLALVMQAVGRQYVRRFNRRHGRTGTLWEGRYRASIIQEDRYLLACLRYLEMNPVRAGMVATPEAYPWSSHRHHLGLVMDPLLSPHSVYWALGNTPFDREVAYRRLFEEPPPLDEQELTVTLLRGHALAEGDFLERLAASTGRQWVNRPVGRPRKRQWRKRSGRTAGGLERRARPGSAVAGRRTAERVDSQFEACKYSAARDLKERLKCRSRRHPRSPTSRAS